MTTIATDGFSMATDGLVLTRSDTIVETDTRKMVRLNDGRVLGVAGCRSDLFVLAEWLNAGADPEKRPKFESDALIIGPNGIECYDCALIPMPVNAPAALGTGSRFALTAMDMGQSPEQAVVLASRRDPFTGGTIRVEYIGSETTSFREAFEEACRSEGPSLSEGPPPSRDTSARCWMGGPSIDKIDPFAGKRR